MQTDRNLRRARGRLATGRRRTESLAESHAARAVIVREHRLHGLGLHDLRLRRDRIS
jgi:rRNA processing protein Krr1/Pno1